MKRTAIVFGATGLVGTELVKQLAGNEGYGQIKAFVRRNWQFPHPKVETRLFDPGNPGEWTGDVHGNDLFCCLGTTMKKAGTRENFEKSDFHLPVVLAETAGRQGVERFMVVSSIGANAQSSNFYLRTKGKMEQAVQAFPGLQVIIVRPSMLLGTRREFRMAEELGKWIMKPAGFLLRGKWTKYRGIEASTVARAMIRLALSEKPPVIVESDELQRIGQTEKKQ